MGQTAYERWRAQPFPKSGTNEHLDELNKELAYWDAMVADTIVPVAEQGAAYDSGALNLESGLLAYRRSLLVTPDPPPTGWADLIAEHLTYTDLLIAANAEASCSGG